MSLMKLNFSGIYTRSVRYMSKRSSQEVKIPIPGGYIAGKWWGPEDKRPIVAFHGWQDNCGSFDRLIPYLPEHIPVLALDALGHGHSSHLPPGIPYYNSFSSIVVKRIMQFFDWQKISLMGHSLGAIISFTYGYLFPKEVDFLVCIDGLHPLIHPHKTQRVVRSIGEFLKYDSLAENTEEPPSYEFRDMAVKIHEATKKSVNLDVAKYILARNIAPSKKYPGKFYFRRDPRLKVGPLEVMDDREIIRCSADIKFPVFISKAEKSPFFGSKTIFSQVLKVLQENSEDCQFHNVPGRHHVHLNEPEVLKDLINAFILKHDSEDRSTGGLKPEIKVTEEYSLYKVENL